MMKFRKKPVEIEAVRWNSHGDDKGVIVFRGPTGGYVACPECKRSFIAHGWIGTLEGGHRVCPGDWIITGINGERYPCKPDIFKKTYEAV